jgi:hypothetical protein
MPWMYAMPLQCSKFEGKDKVDNLLESVDKGFGVFKLSTIFYSLYTLKGNPEPYARTVEARK